jgi:hypothetical protein
MRDAMANQPTGETSEELKKAKEAADIADGLKKAAEARRDAVKADLERQNLEATRELGLAQAQADIIAKFLPKGEAKPLEGKVDIKDVGPMTRLVAYRAMKKMASEIAQALESKLKAEDKVLIVPQLDFASGDLPLLEIMEQFDLFQQLLTAQLEENARILQEPAPPKTAVAALPVVSMTASTLAIAGAVIPGLANLVGYFKTDYQITGFELDLDKEGLVARVAGAVSEKGKEIYYYNFYSLENLGALPIIQKFAQLSHLSQELESSKNRLGAKKAEVPAGGDTTAIDRAIKDSQALLDGVKSYVQGIVTKASGEDYPRLVRAAWRDWVRKKGITHLLYLNVLPKSGGEVITKRNLWRTTKEVGYLGGATATYMLAEMDGKIILGDTLIRVYVFNYRLEEPQGSDLKLLRFD